MPEVKNKTNDELITELQYVPCLFSRDELFSFVVVNDAQLAGDLKRRNKEGNLTAKDLETNHKDQIESWYYYSNQAPVLSFAANEWRDKHNIEENLVVLS